MQALSKTEKSMAELQVRTPVSICSGKYAHYCYLLQLDLNMSTTGSHCGGALRSCAADTQQDTYLHLVFAVWQPAGARVWSGIHWPGKFGQLVLHGIRAAGAYVKASWVMPHSTIEKLCA